MKALVATCAVLLIAACGPLHPLAAASTPNRTIPWLPLKADLTPAPQPTPKPVPIPPGTPACTASALQAEWMGSQGATGNVITSFAFAGVGPKDCFVDGTPALALLDSQGRNLSFNPRTPDFPPSVIGPALVGVGPLPAPHTGLKYGQISLTIDWVSQPEFCPGQSGVAVAAARIGIPAGGALTVTLGSAPDAYACAGIGVGSFESLPLPAAAAQTPPLPAATLDLSGAAAVGKPYAYLVTLANNTGSPMDLAGNCPNYEEEMFPDIVHGSPPLGGKHFYRLNCAPAGTLAPGAHAIFQMIYAVPADARPGTYTLVFGLGIGNGTTGAVERPVVVKAA